MRLLFGLLAFILFASPGVAQNYNLQQGDVLSVEVLEDPSLNRNVMVLPDGSITFPFVGTLNAEGRSIRQVESSLKSALAPNFASAPTVFVSVASLAQAAAGQTGPTITIYVVGQVNNPGPVQVTSGVNFLQALASTGGFNQFAATKRVQLRRTDPSTGQEAVFLFNLKKVGDGAAISGNTTMRDGDIIFVPERRLFE
ncbi:polysaccharide biosynthesis/export family protein [Pseudoruegeria sp. SK021]|uniref:polysaccharide biosynthesis/export family protein n=1 Tax=Pseudoruegeria sp. SK021 TaxID=1933035 RepID=UPI000A21C54E|nr:polysaccharide biosynthesis/export family protein [Pseudoruegeria sp. SK021]OSP55727.1 hypothetical protein BV911_06375 [Pseudoruegeria sp. SK021]